MIAQICSYIVLARGLCNLKGFPDGVGERFFAIDVFAEFDCGHRDKGMEMVRRGDHDGIDVFLLVEHFAKVSEDFGLRIFFEDASGMSGIDVAKSDNVFAAELFEIGCALAADADASDVEFAAGWC